MRVRDPFSVNARVISHVSRVFVQIANLSI